MLESTLVSNPTKVLVWLWVTVEVRAMRCEDIVEQDVERRHHQLPVEERVQRHHGNLTHSEKKRRGQSITPPYNSPLHSNFMCNSSSQYHVHFPHFYVQYYY